jgi:hypothetical protein
VGSEWKLKAIEAQSSKLKAERKKNHRPDEISATEISLGRRRALRPLRKIKKNLCVLGVLCGESLYLIATDPSSLWRASPRQAPRGHTRTDRFKEGKGGGWEAGRLGG